MIIADAPCDAINMAGLMCFKGVLGLRDSTGLAD